MSDNREVSSAQNPPGAGHGATNPRLTGSDSVLFSTPLRGREQFAEQLADAAKSVEAGNSRVIILRGIPGVGKTRLLGEVLAEASRRGWKTVTATTEPDSNLIPLGSLLDAVARTSPPLLTKTHIQALAGEPDARYWLVQALRDALETATKTQPVAIVIDDMHWLDAASLAVLRSLLPRVADLPLLWALSVRSGEHGAPVSRTMTELAKTATVVDVAALSDSAVDDIVTDIVGAPPGATLSAIMQRTENVPLLVIELLQGLMEENLVTTRSGEAYALGGSELPERFGASIRERIMHLSQPARTLVQIAAVLGHGFTIQNAATLRGRTAAELVEPLAEAVAAHIITDGTELAFRHDAIRDTALGMLPDDLRSQLQRDAWRVRIAAGEPVLAVAATVAQTALAADDDAIALLHDAALELVATDASSAAELAERAIELMASEPRFAQLAVDLVPVLYAGGKATAARSTAAAVFSALPVDSEAHLLLSIARLETESSFEEAIRTCDRALALEGVPDDVRANLYAVKALNYANIGRFVELADTLALATTAATAAEEYAALATVEATESVLRFYENRFGEAYRLITSAEQRIAISPGRTPSHWLPEGLWRAFLSNSLGDGESALRIADNNLAETTRRREAPAMAFWMMLRSRVLLDLGRLDDAKTQAEAVLAIAQDLQLGDFADATAGYVVFRVALYQGDSAEIGRNRDFVRAMSDGPGLFKVGRWLSAIAADDVGDHIGALAFTNDAFATLRDPIPSMTTPADFGDDIDLVRISMRAGAVDRLATILDVVEARAVANPGNALAVGIHHHARGLIENSSDELRHAAAALREAGRPLVLVCALEDLGAALASTDVDSATAAWSEALGIAERCGALRDAGRLRRHLRGIGVVRRPPTSTTPSGLTTRELQVVERLAEGRTTNQIADDLFLSPHTVITHIRHASTKWNVSSRRGLVERFKSQS
ncbi:Predicted ATPase [Agreia pratensis]|uniref:Predicted ATPase n=1 Tax=Agreia pratensis TaxID=150121 RepID=A0A1X7IU60_9MICO|nr:Predicted ATPase [Agreia pratensis]